MKKSIIFQMGIGLGGIFLANAAWAQETTFQNFETIRVALIPAKQTSVQISQMILLPLFAFYMLHQQMKMTTEQQNFAQGVIQLVMIFICLAIYDHFFSLSSAFFGEVSERIFTASEFKGFTDRLAEMAPSADASGLGQLWGFLRFQALGVLAYLSFWFVTIATYFLILLRNVMLGFLYVVGPIWLAVSMLPDKQSALYRFFEQVLIVNGWTIVSNIVFKIMYVAFYQESHNVESHFIEIISANLALATLILGTPKLTAKLASGTGVGSANALPMLHSQITKLSLLALAAGKKHFGGFAMKG